MIKNLSLSFRVVLFAQLPLFARFSAALSFCILMPFCVAAHAGDADAAALKRVKMMPMWTPQAQFAGYYMAYEKGIYAKHGIDLEIMKSGPGFSPTEALEKGHADFAVLWLSTAVNRRAHGVRLQNLAQLVQKSSLMLVSRKASGIHSLKDMHQKKVGLWEGDLSIPVKAVFRKKNIQVRTVSQSQTVNLFLRGGIDVASAMWYNEYHTLLNSGLNPDELNVFFMSEYEMNFPEDGLYAMERTLKKDPALAAAFVNASLEGWRYAFAHPEESVQTTLKYMARAGLPANASHQAWMLNRMRDLFQPLSGGEFGQLDRQSYQFVAKRLQQERLIQTVPKYQDFVWEIHVQKR